MNFISGPVQHLQYDWCNCELSIKRLDLIHSWASGNKYYKLKYNILSAVQHGFNVLISKGGMFSNHLEAFARACKYFNLKCICVIRSFGDDPGNPTLRTLRDLQAQLIFVSPDEYKSFDEEKAAETFKDAFFIPEGGSNKEGIKGSGEIMQELDKLHPTHVVISGGTITTAAGIIQHAGPNTNVIIVPAWKGCTDAYVQNLLTQHSITETCKWNIWPDYHFGGFGKYDNHLFAFMHEFTVKTNIPLEPVYTGKMMFAVFDKIRSGYFSTADRIIAVHTGGLQGLEGYKYRDPQTWSDYADLACIKDKSIFQ